MKIGYLLQSGVPDIRERPLSGPARHVQHVVEELRNLGHQVRLLAFLDDEVWTSDDADRLERVSTPWLVEVPWRGCEGVMRRLQYRLGLPRAALLESLRFAQACRQQLTAFDLLYERMGWFGYSGSLASRWLRIPLVFEVNGDHLSELRMQGMGPKGPQRQLSITLMRWAIRRCAHVVATGDGWRDRFVERWHVQQSKITTVENGSGIVDLLQREQLRAFRDHHGADGETTLAYVGGYYPWHGIPILLEGFALALRQGAAARLLLCGATPGIDQAQRQAAELGLGDRVTFTGQLPIDELADQLTKADIGIASYCGRAEFSGLKLLDYKSAGLATIATGESGRPSVLEHGKTGWIVAPGDARALSEAIVLLSSDVSLRKRLGRAARMDAERRHGWRHTAQELLRVFDRALAERDRERN